jgi:hypothetical protein
MRLHLVGQDAGKVTALDLESDTYSAYVMYHSRNNSAYKFAIINIEPLVEGESTSSRGQETLSFPVSSTTSSLNAQRLNPQQELKQLDLITFLNSRESFRLF